MLLLFHAGCGWIGAAAYMLRPQAKTAAEFTLTGRIAIVIENARSQEENPLFSQTLYDQFLKDMEAAKAPVDAVPFDEFLRLRQSNPDFARWGVQRIGRELKADQVLYIRLLRLQFRERRDSPVLEPRAAAEVVVVGVDASSDKPRLWPDGVEGRTLSVSRQVRDATDPQAVDDEAIKLARDMAHLMARFFHEFDPEQQVEREK